MDEREYRRRIRRNRIAQEEKKRIRQQLRQTMGVCALANMCHAMLVCCLWSAYDVCENECACNRVRFLRRPDAMAAEHAQVVGKYDAPKQQWFPGHRGVDLRARPQEAIVAPADGVIAFSGNVAGKSVVTIRHGEETGPDLDVRTRHCATRCRCRTSCARGAFRSC